MRPGQQQQKNRMRGRTGRKGPNPLSRSYESNGPDVKIRGTAQHVAEKYSMLARDSAASGDRVMAENYLQHAEHYNRIIMAAQGQFQPQRDDFAGDEDEGDDAPDATYFRPVERPDQRQDRAERSEYRGDRDARGDGRQGQERGGERFEPRQDRGERFDNRPERNDRSERNDRPERRPYQSNQPNPSNGEGRNGPGNGFDRRERFQPHAERQPVAGTGPQPYPPRETSADEGESGRGEARAFPDNRNPEGRNPEARGVEPPRGGEGRNGRDSRRERFEQRRERFNRFDRPATDEGERTEGGDVNARAPSTGPGEDRRDAAPAPSPRAEITQARPVETRIETAAAPEDAAPRVPGRRGRKPAAAFEATVPPAPQPAAPVAEAGEAQPVKRRPGRPRKKRPEDEVSGENEGGLPDFLLASNG